MIKAYHNTIDDQAFKNQYIKNFLAEQIKIKCPTCGMETSCFPEHLERAHCHICNLKGIESKLVEIK
jgi:ribosomal protein S27E